MKKAVLKLTEVVCGPKTRCYALQHAIDRKGIEPALVFNTKTGRSRTGLGVRVVQEKPKKKVLFFFNYCPWCGGLL